MHIYHAERWQEGTKWRVADTNDLTHGSANWYLQPNVWGQTPKNFVHMIKEKFKAKDIRLLPTDRNETGYILSFCFDSEADANKYKNAINKRAKEINFVC